MTTTTMNGRARKSLAEQIDRLEGTLDGLADGLNDAVVAAVRDAVGVAVQEAVSRVLREVLANPVLVGRLQAARETTKPAAEPKPSMLARLVGAGRRLGRWIGHCLQTVVDVAQTVTGGMGRGVASAAKSVFEASGQGVARVGRGCRRGGVWLTMTVARIIGQITAGVRMAWRTLVALRRLSLTVLMSLVAGLVGVAAFHVGPWLAALSSGAGGFVTALVAQVVFGVWRTVGRLRTAP